MNAELKNKTDVSSSNDENILAIIVDAMLEAKPFLDDASSDEWRQILRAACRSQKKSAGGAATVAV